MTHRSQKKVGLAAMGIAALSLDLLAVFGMAPLATEALRNPRAQALLKAGGLLAHAISVAARDQATRVAESALIGVAQGTTHVYAAMLSVTPREHARHVRVLKYRAAVRRGHAASECPLEAAKAWGNTMAIGAARRPASCVQRAL